jgi:magnesium chelatase family protein
LRVDWLRDNNVWRATEQRLAPRVHAPHPRPITMPPHEHCLAWMQLRPLSSTMFGAGKTMLASRLPGLLPPPDPEEALELATIASVAGVSQDRPSITRPLRAPHHSCSETALIGGGHPIRPGEVTLAHRGVLFLDELPEFRRNAIEALRPTMESGRAVVVRARERVVMPGRPLVVAAMNPCPCGFAS